MARRSPLPTEFSNRELVRSRKAMDVAERHHAMYRAGAGTHDLPSYTMQRLEQIHGLKQGELTREELIAAYEDVRRSCKFKVVLHARGE